MVGRLGREIGHAIVRAHTAPMRHADAVLEGMSHHHRHELHAGMMMQGGSYRQNGYMPGGYYPTARDIRQQQIMERQAINHELAMQRAEQQLAGSQFAGGWNGPQQPQQPQVIYVQAPTAPQHPEMRGENLTPPMPEAASLGGNPAVNNQNMAAVDGQQQDVMERMLKNILALLASLGIKAPETAPEAKAPEAKAEAKADAPKEHEKPHKKAAHHAAPKAEEPKQASGGGASPAVNSMPLSDADNAKYGANATVNALPLSDAAPPPAAKKPVVSKPAAHAPH